MAKQLEDNPQVSSTAQGEEVRFEVGMPTISESDLKLRTLMDRIDMLTHSLDNYSQRMRVETDQVRRRHGPENEDEKDLISQNTSIYTIKLTKQPSCIAGGTMRDYQLEGLNWLLKMHHCKINGVLADEMGLGKTLQTIALLSQVHEPGAPHIVIVPKSTLSNWSKEFAHWCPALSVFIFYGPLEERELIRPKVARTDTYAVLLTTYETAMAEKATLKTIPWNYLVIDEAHRIKNEKSVLSQVVRMFSTQRRLLITGTPLQNNLHELWSLLNFLMPQIFSSSEDFDNWFNLAQSDTSNQEFLVQQLHKILKPFMLRRLKREVETRLPPKNELYVFLGMTELQRGLYRDLLTKNIEVVNGAGERAQLMNTIMQLRKMCNHPYLFDGVEPGPPYIDGEHLIEASMKFVFLDKLLPKLLAKEAKVLIFSQMTRLLDILDDFLSFRGYRFCRIDGSTHYITREEQIEEFQRANSETRIFILSTRAGGLGINLHAANTVIIYDSDWNPQVDIQAMDRAHRIGQTRMVTVYRFVTSDTVEEKITERAAKKLKMDHLVIQKGALATQHRAPSINEMNQIVQFGAQKVLKSSDEPERDVDKILQYAFERTENLNHELAKLEEAFNLSNLKLDGSDLYEFEGNNYRNKEKKQYISLGTRSRKTVGFFDAEKGSTAKKNKKKDWRMQVGGGHPHQFFNIIELDRLQVKEDLWNDYINNQSRQRRSEHKPEKFTDRDRLLKEELMKQGFSDWNKKDFNNFVRACEMYGRFSKHEILSEIGNKNMEELEEYMAVFWENYMYIPNGAEIVRRIEEGEKYKIQLDHIERVLSGKRRRIEDEEETASLHYGAEEDSKYTKDEDKFLLKCMFDEGYGNWDDIRCEIKNHPDYRFNFWIQSRSPEDIKERCDHIVSLIESEGARPLQFAREEGNRRVQVTPELNWIITIPSFNNK